MLEMFDFKWGKKRTEGRAMKGEGRKQAEMSEIDFIKE